MGGKDTRWRIVEAAMELFWLKGYASTSIADILSRSQVNSGSLYYFFPGKQDVLLAVLEAYRDGIGTMLLEPAWSDVEDPVEKGLRAAGAVPPRDRRHGMPIRLSHRQPRARASRCGSGRPRAPGGEFHGLGRCGGGLLPRCRLALSTGHRLPRPRRARAKRDGRRDAVAHLSRRCSFRPRGRPVPHRRGCDACAGDRPKRRRDLSE